MNTANQDVNIVHNSKAVIVTEDMFDTYDEFDVVDYCQSCAKICNQGLDIFDAFDVPLAEAYGKTKRSEDGVAETMYEPPKRTKWSSKIVWTAEQLAWEAECPILDEPYYDEPYFPSQDALQFGKTSTKIDFPELDCFDETPAQKAIVAAAQYATLLEAEGSDPTDVLHRFEDMWNLPVDSTNFLKNYRAHDVSIPRMIAAAGKVRNPIYGLDNYAGCVKILRSDITRSSFLSEKDVQSGAYSVVDFGRFHSFLRYVVAANLALPGVSSDAIKTPSLKVGWTVSKKVAKIYHPGDHLVKLPKRDRSDINPSKSMLDALARMVNPTYLMKLIGMYEKISEDERDDITLKMLRKSLAHLNALAKRGNDKVIKRPMSLYDNIKDETGVMTFPTRSYKPFAYAKTDVQIISDSTFTANDETAFYYTGVLHSILHDVRSPFNMFGTEKNQIAQYAENTVAKIERDRVCLKLTQKRVTPDTLANFHDIKLSKTLDEFGNFIKVAIFADFEYFRTKVHGSYDKLHKANLVPNRFTNPTINVSLTVLRACSRFAAYYKGKGETKRSLVGEVEDVYLHAKRVFYQTMSKFYMKVAMSPLDFRVIYPSPSAFIYDIGKKYAAKRHLTFSGVRAYDTDRDLDFSSAYLTADELDMNLDPKVKFKYLVSKIEETIALTLADKDWFEKNPINFPKNKNDETIFKPKGFGIINEPPDETAIVTLSEIDDLSALMGDFDLDAMMAGIDDVAIQITEATKNADSYDKIWSVMLSSLPDKETMLEGLKRKFSAEITSADDMRTLNLVYTNEIFGADMVAGVYGKVYSLEGVSESVAIHAALQPLETIQKGDTYDVDDVI